MEFRILGPVELVEEHRGLHIVPMGAKQRALLGALLVKAGQSLSVPRLVDELWGEEPPANAPNALQAHVARLRRLLPVQAPGSGVAHHEWIVTHALGYTLRLGPAGTDAARFQELASLGRDAVDRRPEQAIELLRQALALWRGPALEGCGTGDICTAEAAQLEEYRLTALETLYDACLRVDRHQEITAGLEELTVDHPVRERFYDLLMLALYRSGRQAEALSVYERARRRLVREIGVEPGPALRARMQAILHHDPALEPDTAHGGRDVLDTAGGLVAPSAFTPPGGLVTADPSLGSLGSAGSLDLVGAFDPVDEIAQLRRRLDQLAREHAELARRIDRLVSHGTSGPRWTASAAR